MMNFFFHTIFFIALIFEAILAIYLLIPLFSLLTYGFVNLFKIKSPFERRVFLDNKNYDFGIIITAHQETKFVIPLVDSIIKQTYSNFSIYVIADDCDPASLKFDNKQVIVLKPVPALHSKIKSIHYGFAHFIRKHDAVIILDADNLIHPLFLEVMNNHFRKGYRVVQAQFKPKNIDSNYARMDAIGDIFNFFIEREIRMRLNLSATIWGSGVAIDRELYENIEYKDSLGGFDKKLQAHLVQRVDRIGFAPDAILFDEKISSGASLENQRTRWISSYFKYFKESFKIFVDGIKKADFNLIYFGFITLRPPLFIVLGCAFLFTIINYFINSYYFYSWLIVLFSFVFSFVAIVIVKGKDFRFIQTLFIIPVFALRQTVALLKIKKAKKSFLKTQHSKLVFIDDLIETK